MREIKNDSSIVEKILFKYTSFNVPNLQTDSRLIKFKFNKLLNVNLMKSVLYTKLRSKKFRKRNIYIGIKSGQISVMRLGKKAEFNQYMIH